MAEYKRDEEASVKRASLLDRIERLEEARSEITDAIERLGDVLERACREIGIDPRERHG